MIWIETTTFPVMHKMSLAARVTRVGVHALEEPARPKLAIKVGKILGHESILEHGTFSVIIYDISRALVEVIESHRLASYSEMSFRLNQGKRLGFSFYWKSDEGMREKIRQEYHELLKKEKPEDARAILPLSTLTDMMITANVREWILIYSHLRGMEFTEDQTDFAREVQEFVKEIEKLFSELDYGLELLERENYPSWSPWSPVDASEGIERVDLSSGLESSYKANEAVFYRIVGELSNAALAQLKRHRMGTLIIEPHPGDIYDRTMAEKRKFAFVCNKREWEHVKALRTSPHAQKEIREWATSVSEEIEKREN